MEITHEELIQARETYWELRLQLTPQQQAVLPHFHTFLSPSGWTKFLPHRDGYELSITGAERYRMLFSTHALALLTAYALRRLYPHGSNSNF